MSPGLPFTQIDELPGGGPVHRGGATVRNTAVAAHRLVRERSPLLSQAILFRRLRADSQHGDGWRKPDAADPLCLYFYDEAANCNKRYPQTGCDAIGGFNRMHAILGTSPSCIAAPFRSDMCVALAALGATVHVEGPRGTRAIPFDAFHRLPGDTPHIETDLQPDELITSVWRSHHSTSRGTRSIERFVIAPAMRSPWSASPPPRKPRRSYQERSARAGRRRPQTVAGIRSGKGARGCSSHDRRLQAGGGGRARHRTGIWAQQFQNRARETRDRQRPQ